MTRLPARLSDRTALVGSSAAALTGLPPTIIACYISARLVLPVLLIFYARLVLPVLLIFYAAHTTSPAQRIALVRDYLLYQPATVHRPTTARPKTTKRRTH